MIRLRTLLQRCGGFRPILPVVVALLVLGCKVPARGHESPFPGSTAQAGTSAVRDGTAEDPLFRPLIADPVELISHASFLAVNTPDSGLGDFTGAFVGIAGHYPLYEQRSVPGDHGWNVGIAAGILSQFNLDAPSHDLLNTDFLVGVPVRYRNGSLSLRGRVMHQSSHLGDELLLSPDAPDRVNLSLEFVDLLIAYRIRDLRIYGGGAYALRRDPGSLKRTWVKAGVEYVESRPIFAGFRPLAAANLTRKAETDWDAQTSLQVGFRNRRWFAGRTRLDVVLEAFKGPLPFGQFFTNRTEYIGVGLYLNR